VDARIHELLNDRARLARQVGISKHADGHTVDFYRPEREAQVLRMARERNKGPLRTEETLRLFREIMSACLAQEEPLKVAFLGPEGTFSQTAALKHFGLESGRDVSVIPLRDNRLTALESGTVDAALLGVPENIIAVDKGYNELLFLGDVLSFPQNGFGALAKRIQENPDEVYRMVRATLRGFLFSLEPRNRDEVINIILNQWRLTDRRLAAEMLKQFGRGIMRDMSVRPEGIQLMIDLVREDAKIAQPFSVSQIADFSFLEKARRELGVAR